MKRTTLALFVLALFAPRLVAAQTIPLAAVAQKEEARRAAMKAPTKTYTNADLKRDPRDEPPPAADSGEIPSGYESKSTGKVVSAEEMLQGSNEIANKEQAKQDEQKWRARADQARADVAKAQDLVTEYEKNTNNSPAQAAALKDARSRLASAQAQWERLQTNADTQKVPKAWLQPQQ